MGNLQTLPPSGARRATSLETTLEELDALHAKVADGSFQGMTHVPQLGILLEECRRLVSGNAWKDHCQRLREHPLSKIVLQDPFTQRSFFKPRGYAGDAVMLDFIYQHPSAETHWLTSTKVGREVFAYTTVAPSSKGVLGRRNLLADLIDRTTGVKGKPIRVLSLACGHLRELELSEAVRSNNIQEFVGIDQDPATILTLKQSGHGSWLRPIEGSVKDLLSGRLQVDQYDLVYSAGLFDYLPDRVCIPLLTCLKNLLAPNATLLVATFLEGIGDRGYMECCMDWWLTYRTEAA